MRNHIKISRADGNKVVLVDIVFFDSGQEYAALGGIIEIVRANLQIFTPATLRLAAHMKCGEPLDMVAAIGEPYETGRLPVPVLRLFPPEAMPPRPQKLPGHRQFPQGTKTDAALRALKSLGRPAEAKEISQVAKRSIEGPLMEMLRKLGYVAPAGETRRGVPTAWFLTENGEKRCG